MFRFLLPLALSLTPLSGARAATATNALWFDLSGLVVGAADDAIWTSGRFALISFGTGSVAGGLPRQVTAGEGGVTVRFGRAEAALDLDAVGGAATVLLERHGVAVDAAALDTPGEWRVAGAAFDTAMILGAPALTFDRIAVEDAPPAPVDAPIDAPGGGLSCLLPFCGIMIPQRVRA